MPPKPRNRPRPAPPSSPRKGKPKSALSIILFGESGSGKTTLAGHFPKVGALCDSEELGIEYLSEWGLIPDPVWIDSSFDPNNDRTWPKFVERVNKAATDSRIETVLVESVTGLERMAQVHCCSQRFNGNWEVFRDYSKGAKETAKNVIPQLITAMNNCRTAGKTVILTAHTRSKESTDATGEQVMKYIPYCDVDTANVLHRWAVCSFFLEQQVQQDPRRGGLRKIARPGVTRVLYTEEAAHCKAKNWIGLTGVVSMGDNGSEAYKNLMEAIDAKR